MSAVATRPAFGRLFLVLVRRADGTSSCRLVAGGHPCDHCVAAIDDAGERGSVRVVPIKPPTSGEFL